MPHTTDLNSPFAAPDAAPEDAPGGTPGGEPVEIPEDILARPAPPPMPRFTARDVFLGKDGLRAGWSLLIYMVLLAALLAVTGLLLRGRHRGTPPPPTHFSPRSVMIGEGVQLFCVAVATWIMAKIERRPNHVFGLGGRRQLPNFLAGLAWGLALLTLLVACLRATGLLIFDARLLFGHAALRYAAIWFAGFLLVGLFEEYFFRGYLQYTLARGLAGIYGLFSAPRIRSNSTVLGFWTAAALISFGFGFTHKSNAGESPIGLLSAGLIGIVFCLSLWRTGSLWWAIGFHAAWDWAQSFLYGVGDSGILVPGRLFSTHPVGRPILSGGITGPEGSLFILPIVALTAIAILLTLPNLHNQHEGNSD